jgi:hypothetical protein
VITDGFQPKLILLRGYMKMVPGIEEFGLPCMTIDNLFMPEKLGSLPPNPSASLLHLGSLTTSQSLPIQTDSAMNSPEFPPGLPQRLGQGPPTSPRPQSYSAALQLDHSGSSGTGGTSNHVSMRQSSSPKAIKARLPTPGVVECNYRRLSCDV